MKEMLEGAGFEKISIAVKENAEEFIKDWIPGSDAEKVISSAYVTAYKPEGKPGIRDDPKRPDILDTKIEYAANSNGAIAAGC